MEPPHESLNNNDLAGQIDEISAIVSQEFQIESTLVSKNEVKFWLKETNETKQPFLNLLRKLSAVGRMAVLRRDKNQLYITVFPKPQTTKNNNFLPIALLLLTLVTLFLSGDLLFGNATSLTGGLCFTASMLATLGIHELGHKLWANRSGVKTTWPYFIPGPPPLGTFGAVIFQKTPAPNRDALFDVGASGPVMGFLASVMFTAIGFITNFGIVASNIRVVHIPLIFDAIVRLTSSQDSIVLNPFIFAGLIGLFITWINLIPASTLDGGHVANAVLTKRAHQFLTFLSIVAVTLIGYWALGVFLVLTWMMQPVVPLDNVSELSAKRKLATLCLIAIFLLCVL